MTEQDLQSIFGEYNVKSATIPSFRGKSKGFGFVQLGGESDVKRVFDELKDVSVEGRVLMIKQAKEGQVKQE